MVGMSFATLPTLQATSKSSRQRQSHGQRLCRMHMAIGDAADRLARQPRQIVIFDLVGFRRLALQRLEQADPDIITARLQPDAGLRLDTADAHIEGMAGVEAIDRAPVRLAELVA